MRIGRSFALTLAVVVAPFQVSAAPKGDLSNLAGIATLNGTCSRLVMADNDASDSCVGQAINSMYNNGRTGFAFQAGDMAIVTFSGIGTPAKGDLAESKLDHVIFGLVGTGTEPNSVPATGKCTYTNPYAGPSHINCFAKTKSGTFSASFVSDGAEPDVQEF